MMFQNTISAVGTGAGGTFRIDIKYSQTYLDSPINEEQFLSNPITFIPPPTKVSIEEGIDILITTITAKIPETMRGTTTAS